MGLDRKKVREITGYTHDQVNADPEEWMGNARLFKNAADLIATQNEYSPPLPFYFNAGLSIELGLKAVAVAKLKDFPKTHKLIDLVRFSDLEITLDQEVTLELLSELIIWAGRYPVPKKVDEWNRYNDDILGKHKVRAQNTGKVLMNQDVFPTLENYHRIWDCIFNAYKSYL